MVLVVTSLWSSLSRTLLNAGSWNAEKAPSFYGSVNLKQSESLFAYYEPIYRVIIQGNLNQIVEELNLLEKVVLENTPRVPITKQLFYPVYHGMSFHFVLNI